MSSQTMRRGFFQSQQIIYFVIVQLIEWDPSSVLLIPGREADFCQSLVRLRPLQATCRWPRLGEDKKIFLVGQLDPGIR